MSTVDSCSKVCSCGGIAASDVTGTFYCTLCGENVSLQSAKRIMSMDISNAVDIQTIWGKVE